MSIAERSTERVVAIMPAYREEGRIGPVIEAVRRQGVAVVVVDDGSPDRTAEVAAAAGAQVVRHPQNRGKGCALNTGFAFAREQGYGVCLTLDSDGQHDPAAIPAFIEAYVRTGFPVLVGNRMTENATMPRVRRWTNRFMSGLLSRLMGQYVPDTQCGYRLYRTDVLPFVEAFSERFAAESEILLHIAARGIRIGSVRVPTIYAGEQSKINPFADTLRFLGMLARYFRARRAAPPPARPATQNR